MPTEKSGNTNIIVIAAAAVIVIAGLKTAGPILIPLLLAVFIATLTMPLVRFMVRYRVPEVLSVVVVLLFLLGLVLLFASFIGTTVNAFYKDIPLYEDRFNHLSHTYIEWLRAKGFAVSNDIVRQYINPGQIMRMVAGVLNSLRGMLTSTMLILLIIMFILLEASSLPDKLKRAFGNTTSVLEHFSTISYSIQYYLRLKTIISFVTGLLAWAALKYLEVPYAELWGVTAFLFNFIPTIGSFVAAIPPILLALIMIDPITAISVAIIYIIINTVVGSVIEPRLMGNSLGISPLVVFLSLVFWGWVWGPIGMILSVPLTMVAKIALGVNPSSRWLAVLLGR